MNTPREQASTTDGRSTTNYTRRGARLALAAALGAATLGAGGGVALATPPPPVCQSYQWVGTKSGCPMAGGWDLDTISTSATSDYCVYTWQGPLPPTSTDIIALDAATGVQDLTEDCLVLYPQSYTPSIYDAQIADVLRDNLRNQALGGSLPDQPAPAARVVVIDTAPDAQAGALPIGTDRHGDTLAHVIEDIVCQGSSCVAEVTTALALPWVSSSTKDLVNGGYLGTRADLAKAIVSATQQWQQDIAYGVPGTPPSLILNLSVGWEDPGWVVDCSTPAKSANLPSCAVYEALQDAAAAGALIIAAAGNHTWGPSPASGLLDPGRWQTEQGDGQDGLLLAAAHGVDDSDHPLATLRPQGTAVFAAPAQGGVAWAPGAPLPPALTGSSVAAAVLSAVSAVVWAFEPKIGAADVLRAVYQGGVQLGAADSCPWPFDTAGDCDIRRVSACGALGQLETPRYCSAAPQPQAFPLQPPGLVPTMDLQGTGWPSPDQLPNDIAPTPQIVPAVFPQPLFPNCPSCWVYRSSPTSTLDAYVSLSAPLSGPVLVLNTNAGDLAIPLALTSAGAMSVSLPSLPPTTIISSAYITGYDSGYSVTSPISVLP